MIVPGGRRLAGGALAGLPRGELGDRVPWARGPFDPAASATPCPWGAGWNLVVACRPHCPFPAPRERSPRPGACSQADSSGSRQRRGCALLTTGEQCRAPQKRRVGHTLLSTGPGELPQPPARALHCDGQNKQYLTVCLILSLKYV